MSISSRISKELIRVEKILKNSGLYKQFSYIERTDVETSYNPITGDHESDSSSTTYLFNAVVLNTRSADRLEASAYSLLSDIIVMSANVEFDMRPGLEFTLGTQVWNVSSFTLNPENSMYEITLGRK